MATLQIGDVKPKQIYYGSAKIKEAWLGDTKLWSSSVPTLVTVGNNGKIYYSLDMITWKQATVISSLINNGSEVTITNDGNKFVILTIQNGVIYSFCSEDGINWTSVTPTGMIGTPTSIEYHNGIFVASSTYGLYYSYNGVNWTSSLTSTSYYIIQVKYLNGRFVAVGTSGKTFYSYDGISWTAMTIVLSIPGNIANGSYSTVTYGNGVYIMSGGYITDDNIVRNNSLFSYDGATWTTYANIYDGISSLTHGKSVFVGALRGVSISEQGFVVQADSNPVTRWTRTMFEPSFYDVKYVPEIGKFIAVGDKSAFYSLDGANWTSMSGLNTDAYTLYWETSYKE